MPPEDSESASSPADRYADATCRAPAGPVLLILSALAPPTMISLDLRRRVARGSLPAALCFAALACGCSSNGDGPEARGGPRAPRGDEPWFRREAWRAAPEPAPPAPIERKEPDLDGSGAGLAAPPTPPSVDDDNVLHWLPGASSDTVTLAKQQTGYTLSGATIQASARTALIAYQGGGPYVGTTLTDCVVHVAPNTVPDGRSFWGLRGYDMSETTLREVEITGFGKVTPKHDEGHAIYLNVVGPLTLEDCNIHHNGGQGLQLVNRPYESNLPAGPAKGAIEVRRTWFHENGFNPDRGAFQVSIFGTGQDVTLSEVEIVAGRDATTYPDGKTGGGLVIEAEGPHPDKRNTWWHPLPKGQTEPPFTQGQVLLDRVLIDQPNANRAIAQIKGCRELVVTGCTFPSGRVFLDDPTKPGRPNGTITWTGNRGDAIVFLNGEPIGPVTEDFVAKNGALVKDQAAEDGR